jgi:hypothetical protein
MMAETTNPTLNGIGPLAEHYFVVVRNVASGGPLFWSETAGGRFSRNEETATRYATAALAHGAILQFEIGEPVDVAERVSKRCCRSPQIQTFTCDGAGGSYELEWCGACGSLRFEEFAAKTGMERKFTAWMAPTSPDPGRWKSLLGALVGTLPRCATCGKPATRSWLQGMPAYCDVHGTPPVALTPVQECANAEPLRAAIAALKERA